MEEYKPSVGFSVELQDGTLVNIVDKTPDPQQGTVLVADDGKVYQDDYNTLTAAYEVAPEPVEEPAKKTAKKNDAA